MTEEMMAQRDVERPLDPEAAAKKGKENESVIRMGTADPEEMGQNEQRREGGSSRDPEKGSLKP